MTAESELFKMCKLLMLYGGIWMQGMPNWSKFTQNLYKVFSWTTQILYVICLPLFSAEVWMEFGTTAGIEALKSLTFISVAVAKLFIVQSKKIADQIALASNKDLEITSSPDPEIKRIYKVHVKFSNISSLAFVLSLYITGSVYIADGLYETYSLYKNHLNITETTRKSHLVELWFPFPKDKYYKTAVIYEIFHIVMTMNYYGATQVLVNSVLVFLKAEMKILQYNIKNIDTSGKGAYITLKDCAIKHQILGRWISEFNASFQYIILLEYCVISLTIATVLIDFMQGKRLAPNVAHFVLMTLELFLLSWNANEILLESSSGISDALYECTWFELDRSSKKLFQFMVMRCRKPLTISIGPFGFVTLDAAVSRMKLSYSVVTVLSPSSSS